MYYFALLYAVMTSLLGGFTTMAASKHGSRCYPGFSLIISCLVLLMCQRSYLSQRICADLRWDAAEALTLGFMEDLLSTRFYSTQRTTWRRTFTLARIPHNTGAICSFQLHLRCGDIHSNPGPLTNRRSVKFPCGECQQNVRSNQDVILCVNCQQWFHASCINMSKASFRYYLQNYNLPWTCLFCSMPKFSDSFFYELNGKDFELNQPAAVKLPEGDVAFVDYLAQTASKLALAPKDLRVAHLDICSIGNKMKELRACSLRVTLILLVSLKRTWINRFLIMTYTLMT